MTFTRSLILKLLVLLALAVLIYAGSACGTGKVSQPTLLGIFVHPVSATVYAHSAQSQVIYTAVAGYSNGAEVPLTSGVEWRVTAYWVSFDSATSTANCDHPAPLDLLFDPTAASVSASFTMSGNTYSDTASLYCL